MLRVEKVRSSYGRVEVLKGIDLEVAEAEIVTVIGSNGAGKSTLMRAISGVQPISSGRVLFRGENITAARASRRLELGVAQCPEGRQVFAPLSVDANLRLGAYRRADAAIEGDKARIYAMFPILREKQAVAAGLLSGGQQQMLAIGRALMASPRLLLLDEPTLGLSPILIDQIFEAIQKLRRDGITILLVEQNASAALAVADRAYLLETGSVVQSGIASKMSQDPSVRQAYLGI